MKRNTTIGLFIFLRTLAYSQDSLWQELKVDENLSISFPMENFGIDTSSFPYGEKKNTKGFHSIGTFSILGVSITDDQTNYEKPTKDFLDQVSKEVCNEGIQKGWSCIVTDTTINKIACKKSVLHLPNSPSKISSFRYIFFLNGNIYIFHIIPLQGNISGAIEDSKKLLNGINFIRTVKEQKPEASDKVRPFNNMYRLIYIAGVLLIIAIITYVIKKKKVKLNSEPNV